MTMCLYIKTYIYEYINLYKIRKTLIHHPILYHSYVPLKITMLLEIDWEINVFIKPLNL